MEKCRICLLNKRKLVSVMDKNNKTDITFANMITTLANVKVNEEHNKICCLCRDKLKEAYNFRNLIEESDAILSAEGNVKRIKFNAIDDILIEVDLKYIIPPLIPKNEDVSQDNLREGLYGNVVIKKIELDHDAVSRRSSLSLDPECTDNYDIPDFESSDGDTDYVPPKSKHNKPKNKTRKRRQEKENMKMHKVCITPAYFTDIGYIYDYDKKPRKTKKKVNKVEDKVCPYCGKLSKKLDLHLVQHTGERKYKCDFCDKKFFTAHSLKAHRNKHINKGAFKCKLCVAVFNDKMALKSHMISHEDLKKFVCDICNKDFKRRHGLRRHRLTHSSANKTVMCDLCNMSFFTKDNLNHHMRVHTGERPYNCEICHIPYSYKHDFNRHCFKKHGVFLKRRSIKLMNEEVLRQEKKLMKELMLGVHTLYEDGKPINTFEGPQAALAFQQTLKAIETRQIPMDF